MTALNDALAAAKLDAGQGRATVFMTVSTGVGLRSAPNGRRLQPASGSHTNLGSLCRMNDQLTETLASASALN